jgi:hypothetical protein
MTSLVTGLVRLMWLLVLNNLSTITPFPLSSLKPDLTTKLLGMHEAKCLSNCERKVKERINTDKKRYRKELVLCPRLVSAATRASQQEMAIGQRLLRCSHLIQQCNLVIFP